MTIKPILFSGPMVRALLEGRKTQTRRLLNPQPVRNEHGLWCASGRGYSYQLCETMLKAMPPKLPCAVGDLLYVRETWNIWISSQDGDEWWPARKIPKEDPRPEAYRAHYALDFPVLSTNTGTDAGKGPWRPGIHMPRWASRITLVVSDVRVQRLQEISEEDAEAEGIDCVGLSGLHGGDCLWKDYQNPPTSFTGGHADNGYFDCTWDTRARTKSFKTLWDSLNAKRGFGWEANPWVVAYTFSVIRENVDQLHLKNFPLDQAGRAAHA